MQRRCLRRTNLQRRKQLAKKRNPCCDWINSRRLQRKRQASQRNLPSKFSLGSCRPANNLNRSASAIAHPTPQQIAWAENTARNEFQAASFYRRLRFIPGFINLKASSRNLTPARAKPSAATFWPRPVLSEQPRPSIRIQCRCADERGRCTAPVPSTRLPVESGRW